MLMAARQKGADQRALIPPIDLNFADDKRQAEERMKMALRENDFNRSYNPNDQDRQAPDQNEFEIIQNLYAVERKGSPELRSAYVEMPKTEVAQTRILHRDTTNDGGRIFGGSLINNAIQVAILSIVELCELSLLDS